MGDINHPRGALIYALRRQLGAAAAIASRMAFKIFLHLNLDIRLPLFFLDLLSPLSYGLTSWTLLPFSSSRTPRPNGDDHLQVFASLQSA